MPKRTREWEEAGRHPVAWFNALLRGVDRADRKLIDEAIATLGTMGFRVELIGPREGPHPTRRREAKRQGGGR